MKYCDVFLTDIRRMYTRGTKLQINYLPPIYISLVRALKGVLTP